MHVRMYYWLKWKVNNRTDTNCYKLCTRTVGENIYVLDVIYPIQPQIIMIYMDARSEPSLANIGKFRTLNFY